MTFDDHQMINDIHAELLQYLEDKNLRQIFVSIVEAILLHKPDNPVEYIVNFLKKKYPDETSAIFTMFIEESSKCIDALHDECSMQSDSDDSQAYSVKDFGPQLARRRASISAENLSPVNADPDCTIIQKTDDEANRINSILTTNVLFQHLNHDQKKKIQDAMFPVVRGDKEIIIKQGDAGDNFYIIEVGIVDVFIENKDTPMKQVATYSVGDSFGELAIMYNAPRAATCIANGEVRLWALDRVSFKMILMETAVAKRIEYTNFLRQIPVLKQLNEYELLTIADVLEEEVFSENDVICVEGDQGDRFYFIRDGIAICTERSIDGSKKEIARLSTGSFFGEIALMTSKGRQATVTAGSTLKCLTFDRKTFQRVMGPLEDSLMSNFSRYRSS